MSNDIYSSSAKIDKARLIQESCLESDGTEMFSDDVYAEFDAILSTVQKCLAIRHPPKVNKVENIKVEDTCERVEDTCRRMEEKDQASEEEVESSMLKEYYLALEEDNRRLQTLLEKQQEQLRAVEWARTQERLQWETSMKEREEALLSTVMSVAGNKEILLDDLSSQTDQETSPLLGAAAAVNKGKRPRKWWPFQRPKASAEAALQSIKHGVSLERPSKKWWWFKKHQAAPYSALKDALTSSACKEEADLQKTRKLEEQARAAEKKKQEKAANKAERKAEKAERKRAKKEEKKAGKKDNNLKDNDLNTQAGPSGLSNTSQDR